MPDNKFNRDQLYAVLQYAARRLNMTPAQMAEALSGGGIESLAARLSPENAATLQSMLRDRQKAEQLLESPQAQAIIQKLLGNT